MLKRNGRLALLAVAAALTVCGCSAGSSVVTDGTDNASLAEDLANEINPEPDVKIYENFIEAGAAMGLELWDFGVDASVYRSEYEGCEVVQAALGAAYEESGTVGTTATPLTASGSGIPFAWERELPVMIGEKINGIQEGGLVSTTVIDPDGDDSFFQNMPGIVPEMIEPIMQTVIVSEDETARGKVTAAFTMESAGEFAERDTYQSERLGAKVTVYYELVSEKNIETPVALAVFDEGDCTYILSFEYDRDAALSDFTKRVKEFTENFNG